VQKQLKQAQRAAAELRKKHLKATLNQAIATNQKKKMKALTYLIYAEHNKRCYTKFRHQTNPKSQGGLAYVMAL